MALSFIFFDTSKKMNDKKYYLIASAFSFLFYFFIREIFQISGNEHQVNLDLIIVNLLPNIQGIFSKEFFLQSILSQNLVITAFLVFFATIIFNKDYLIIFLPFFMTALMLFLLSLVGGIGNNTGRILSLVSPMLIITITMFIRENYFKFKNS